MNKQQYQETQSFFNLATMQTHSIGLNQANGLALSMATSPTILDPMEWIPLVLKEDGDMSQLDQAFLGQIMEVMINLWQQWKQQLQADLFEFPPLCDLQGEQSTQELKDFCTGYLMGYQLLEQAWLDFYATVTDDLDSTKPLPIYLLKLILPEDEEPTAEIADVYQQMTRSGIYQALPDIFIRLEKNNAQALTKIMAN